MLSYLDSPFGIIDLYTCSIVVGTIFAVLLQVLFLYKYFHKKRTVLFVVCYLITIYFGKYAAAFVRYTNDSGFSNKLKNLISFTLHRSGTHFLGFVICYLILFLPLAHFLLAIVDEFFHIQLCKKEELRQVYEIIFLTLPIQHIFNRIGCFLRGCCYGIPYDGVGAVIFPYNSSLNHSVFPVQILEIIGMLITFILALIFSHKKKKTIEISILGFCITFFISELLLDRSGTKSLCGFTAIQYYCIVITIFVMVKNMLNRKRNT